MKFHDFMTNSLIDSVFIYDYSDFQILNVTKKFLTFITTNEIKDMPFNILMKEIFNYNNIDNCELLIRYHKSTRIYSVLYSMGDIITFPIPNSRRKLGVRGIVTAVYLQSCDQSCDQSRIIDVTDIFCEYAGPNYDFHGKPISYLKMLHTLNIDLSEYNVFIVDSNNGSRMVDIMDLYSPR